MLDALERKENMDKHKKEELQALAHANSSLPKGSIHEYAQQI